MTSPPVPVVSPPEPPQPLTLVCANCHATLSGEYCAACGQRHEPHVHTVAHFAGEAFESVSHADSRLWRTLWYLLARPGFLSKEFFAGRRVSYLPPFRLYLVISVLFFLTVHLPEGAVIELDDEPSAQNVEQMNSLAEVIEQGVGTRNEQLKNAASVIREEAAKEKAALDAQKLNEESDADTDEKPADKPFSGLAKQNGMTEFCDAFKKADPTANENYARLRSACAKISDDGGRELARTVVQNLPRAMFVFLPLLALAMKPLYWRPKRYYVEHLLFLIHNHAFIFLMLTMLAVLELATLELTTLGLKPVVERCLGIVKFAAWVYIIWYVFRAMRNYYRQGWWLTFVKYLQMGLSYISAAVLVLVLLAMYSAISLS